MKTSHFSPDDPLLTAYALGEIAEADRASVEAALAADPALRATVEEIRLTVAQLSAALATEPLPEIAAEPVEFPPRRAHGPFMAKLIRLPQSYYLIGGLAAAGFAVLVYLQQPTAHVARPADSRLAVNLPSPTSLAPEFDAAESKLTRAPAVITFADAASEKVETAREKSFSPAPASVEGLVAEVREEKAKKDNDKALAAKADRETRERVAPAKGEVPVYGVTGASLVSRARRMADNGQTMTAVGSDQPSLARLEGGLASAPAQRSLRMSSLAVGSAFDSNRAANSETYGTVRENTFITVATEPLSTFSIDVDTASYSNVRRYLNSGKLPPRDAVRVEELVNYFPYHYAPPTDHSPFAATLEVASAPWENSHRLVRIGLKGREVSQAARPAANLVFLLDVSGSMNAPNRLPLVKESLRLLVSRLRPDDHVAIVTYAGQSGLALPSTPVAKANEILFALDELSPEGSTNGERGIQLAYDIAKANFVSGGVNRVILCTDGDFNVGVSNRGDLVRLVEEKAKANVFLTVLGFGMGNLKDDTLESLADKGNGNYGYIDSRREAEKLLVEQVGGTLVTIAKDVKIQVEFNPAEVSAYRLIGYENRLLQKQDFNNDEVDAGEIGAGHTVTALYEVIPAGLDAGAAAVAMDDLKYQTTQTHASNLGRGNDRRSGDVHELLTVKVRYKEPMGEVSKKLEFPLVDSGASFAAASDDFKFAAAVAQFGLGLRSGQPQPSLLSDVLRWAEAGLSNDAGGHRAEFIGLIRQAQSLVR